MNKGLSNNGRDNRNENIPMVSNTWGPPEQRDVKTPRNSLLTNLPLGETRMLLFSLRR